jgi:hypothetical protein
VGLKCTAATDTDRPRLFIPWVDHDAIRITEPIGNGQASLRLFRPVPLPSRHPGRASYQDLLTAGLHFCGLELVVLVLLYSLVYCSMAPAAISIDAAHGPF